MSNKEKNQIPVVFAFNNGWAKVPGCVCLTSLFENAKEDTVYEIIVVHSDISQENQDLMTLQVQKYKKHSIRFIQQELKDFHYSNEVRFSHDMYTRLCLPEVLAEYDKVFYADADLIFLTDLSHLYATDLGEDYLGAVPCVWGIDAIARNELKGFEREYLGRYFNSGFILMNLAAMRKDGAQQKLLDLAGAGDYASPDQDVLNIVCFGKVQFFHLQYNTYLNYFASSVQERFAPALQELNRQEEFQEAISQPAIIHCTNVHKPWVTGDCPIWWDYAQKSVIPVKSILRSIKKAGQKGRRR